MRIASKNSIFAFTLLLAGSASTLLRAEAPVKNIDAKGGGVFLVELAPVQGIEIDAESLEAAKRVIKNRLEAHGNKDVVLSVKGANAISVEVAGMLKEEVGETAMELESAATMELHLVHPDSRQLIEAREKEKVVTEAGWDEVPFREKTTELDEFNESLRKELKLHPSAVEKKRKEDIFRKKLTIVIKHEAEFAGDSIKEAHASRRKGSDRFQISVTLEPETGQRMLALTKQNIGKALAIVVDGEVLSAPMIQGEFGAQFEITGMFTKKEANNLAIALSNPSKNPLKVISSKYQPPSK